MRPPIRAQKCSLMRSTTILRWRLQCQETPQIPLPAQEACFWYRYPIMRGDSPMDMTSKRPIERRRPRQILITLLAWAVPPTIRGHQHGMGCTPTSQPYYAVSIWIARQVPPPSGTSDSRFVVACRGRYGVNQYLGTLNPKGLGAGEIEPPTPPRLHKLFRTHNKTKSHQTKSK